MPETAERDKTGKPQFFGDVKLPNPGDVMQTTFF
jgi:hypothetical protein